MSKIFDSINVIKAANVSAEKTISKLKSENNKLRNRWGVGRLLKKWQFNFPRLVSLVIFGCCTSMSSMAAAKATTSTFLLCVLHYILTLNFFDLFISVIKGNKLYRNCYLTLFVVFGVFSVFLKYSYISYFSSILYFVSLTKIILISPF